jgi:RHS repeat-associated protein
VVTTADYDEQDRLTQYGDIVYTHTEAGERLTRTDSSGTTTYTYDAHTNLRAVSLPNGSQIEYLIDGRDRRVGKKIDGVVQKTWIYRDQLSPVAQFDGDGNLTHRFVYAEQAHSPSWMVMIDPVTEVETLYRFLTDHLGSVRLVIEVETGAIAQRIDYGPFGEVLYDSNPGLQPFGFAGGIYDQHTGLVRFGARDYDPEIGRWTAKDPIGFGGGSANVYSYAADPVNWVDIDGMMEIRAYLIETGHGREFDSFHFSFSPLDASDAGRLLTKIGRYANRAGSVLGYVTQPRPAKYNSDLTFDKVLQCFVFDATLEEEFRSRFGEPSLTNRQSKAQSVEFLNEMWILYPAQMQTFYSSPEGMISEAINNSRNHWTSRLEPRIDLRPAR